MNYIPRALEDKFRSTSSFFKAVLVTGARQVGKTTMLKHLSATEARSYVTLDNLQVRELAKNDAALFFQTYKPPILIDEVQYAPELFNQIKIICDETDVSGLFWLTGSQQFSLMQNVQQSLAGRLGILELYSMSQSEIRGISYANELEFNLPALIERHKQAPKNDVHQVFEHIWRGGMPQVLLADTQNRQIYFESYIETYIMRDVMQFGGVIDALKFRKFITACASLTAQLVNYKTLAEASDISQPTAKSWLNLLCGMGIIYLLQPFYSNALKRLSKTPKLYFYDTGLCSYLAMWPTPDTLRNGASNGHYFENYIVSEMIKTISTGKSPARLSFLRDGNSEIDLLLEIGNIIHPFDIKLSANPDKRSVRKFSVLDSLPIARGTGGIICMIQDVIPVDEKNLYIPSNII